MDEMLRERIIGDLKKMLFADDTTLMQLMMSQADTRIFEDNLTEVFGYLESNYLICNSRKFAPVHILPPSHMELMSIIYDTEGNEISPSPYVKRSKFRKLNLFSNCGMWHIKLQVFLLGNSNI